MILMYMIEEKHTFNLTIFRDRFGCMKVECI
jgi:hypothetical protein